MAPYDQYRKVIERYAMKVTSEVIEYIGKIREDQGAIAGMLTELLTSGSLNLDCAIKWRQITFAANNDFHHWICAINPTKNYVALNFHFGSYLDDPAHVFTAGTSRFMRQIRFTDKSQVNPEVINDFASQAISRLGEFKLTWRRK
ncbi:DUF1801 domain-containing protein [bacterium]|nr:DUF1801 domain-containing protein [bacterium]